MALSKVQCTKCKAFKYPKEFSKNKTRKNGLSSYCKECDKLAIRSHFLKTLYNITPEEYDIILKLQGGGCAICGKKPKPGQKRLAVDHDHRSGLIRGLLCWLCNRALGLMKDNALSAMALVNYLLMSPAEQALGERRYGLTGKAKRKKKMVYGGPHLDTRPPVSDYLKYLKKWTEKE